MSQQVLTPELSEIISTHCGKIQCRRINKDFEYLIEKYPNSRVEFDYNLKNPIIIVIDKENEIKIKIHNSFPFKPPKIEVNLEPYLTMLIINSNEKKQILKDMLGKDCLCCNSLICETNWFAQNKIKDIVDEVYNNIEIIHDINNYINNKSDIIEDDNITDDNKNTESKII